MRIAAILMWIAAWLARAEVPDGERLRREFHVKKAVGEFVYLDGGSVHGLREEMRLRVERRQAGEARMAARRFVTEFQSYACN